jgi:hypothetical protein
LNSHWGGAKLQPLENNPVLAPPGSQYSLLLGQPESRAPPVHTPPGSLFAYFPEFQIIKTSLKGTIIPKLLHLLN